MKSLTLVAPLFVLLQGASAVITWGTFCKGAQFSGKCTNYQSTNNDQCGMFSFTRS